MKGIDEAKNAGNLIKELDIDFEYMFTSALTRAQLTIINEFLKEHIQPKGYEMISFAYDLFKRLHNALEVEEVEDVLDANKVWSSNEIEQKKTESAVELVNILQMMLHEG